MAQQQIAKEERSIGELVSDLAGETTTLLRQEIALAQTELTQKATNVGKNIGFLVVGGAVGYAALLVFLVAVVVGIANFVPLWASALIVAVIVGIVAFALISTALGRLKETSLTPKQTVETLKEDAQWLKKQI